MNPINSNCDPIEIKTSIYEDELNGYLNVRLTEKPTSTRVRGGNTMAISGILTEVDPIENFKVWHVCGLYNKKTQECGMTIFRKNE